MSEPNDPKKPEVKDPPKAPSDGELTSEDADKVSGGIFKPKTFNPQPDPPG
jgi:hypothetical protein